MADLAKYGIDPLWDDKRLKEEMKKIRANIPNVPTRDHIRYLALQARRNELDG